MSYIWRRTNSLPKTLTYSPGQYYAIFPMGAMPQSRSSSSAGSRRKLWRSPNRVPDDVYQDVYRGMGRNIQGFMGFVGLGTSIAVTIGINLGLSSKMLQKWVHSLSTRNIENVNVTPGLLHVLTPIIDQPGIRCPRLTLCVFEVPTLPYSNAPFIYLGLSMAMLTAKG